MLSVPEPQPNDPEDLSTALETAAIFSAQGDVREAVRWVRRAAELAGDSGDDMRALTLARAVADLGESMASQPPPPPAAAAPEPARAEEAPPPPPLPGRAEANSGDRITNPGPGPDLLSRPPPPPDEAVAAVPTGPRSTPPAHTADEGWSESDSEPETPRPTNGAALGAMPEALAAPAEPAVSAPVSPVALVAEPAVSAPAAPVAPAAPAVAETAAVVAAPAPPAVAVAAPVPAAPTALSAVRARVEATTEAGVFRVTLLGAGESVGPYGHEAVVVLTDPSAKLT